MPVLLFLVAVVPRVWAPDLAPYGPVQAASIIDASQRAGTPWLRAYADPTFPLAALTLPLLRDLPWPVTSWLAARAGLDGLGAAFLYLAVGHLLGRGAAFLAALLYIASPAVWSTARDVAGTLAELLVAAGLLAAVRVAHRPTTLNGIVLGLVLAAIVRAIPPGWGFVLAGVAALAVGRATWLTGSLTGLVLLLGAGPAIWSRSTGLPPSAGVFAAHWRAVFGSAAWIDPASALPGSVSLAGVVAPAAILMLVLALIGTAQAVISGWRCAPRLLLLPIWAILGALSIAMLPLPTGVSVAPVVMLPLLASLAVVPVATSRWATVRLATYLAVVLLVGLGATTIGLNVRGAEQASHERVAFAAPDRAESDRSLSFGVREVPTANGSLRDWQALADTIQGVVERTGATDLIALGDGDRTSPMLESLLQRATTVRRLPPGSSIVPLERETLFLTVPDSPRPVELTRPSSRVAVFTPFGSDTGARLLTLRPRPAIDWLARTEPVPSDRFADGSAVVGVVADRGTPGRLALTLFWELPAAADGRAVGQTARLTVRGDGEPGQQDVGLPPVDVRRGGELIVQQPLRSFAVPPDSPLTVSVGLLDASGKTISTRDGAQA